MVNYTLRQSCQLASSGFQMVLPDSTLHAINSLSHSIGTPLVQHNVFTASSSAASSSSASASASLSHPMDDGADGHRNKRRNRAAMEVTSAEEWESVRSFQKTSTADPRANTLDRSLNELRALLNKLTDKTFVSVKQQITGKIEEVVAFAGSMEDPLQRKEPLEKMGVMLYDLCSANKFYSKLFADLYTEIAQRYKWVRSAFRAKSEHWTAQFQTIQYVDPDTDYDGFCDMNRKNEARRAMTMFYYNLSLNGFVKKEAVVSMIADILDVILAFVQEPGRTNEVDELTEHIALLYRPQLLNTAAAASATSSEQVCRIHQDVQNLSKVKPFAHESLSSKSIFKYMDMVENFQA